MPRPTKREATETESSKALLTVVNSLLEKHGVSNGLTTKDTNIVDVITFCDGRDYLDLKKSKLDLFISQRIVLKAFYAGTRGNENLQLNEEEWQWLYDHEDIHEMSLVIDKLKNKNPNRIPFKELCLVLGRRAGKCRDENDVIPTTHGSITFKELLKKLGCNEKIGICTYDPQTLKRSITYDIKASDNGIDECFMVVTKRGIKETSSWNHPYLVWRDDNPKPEFVKMAELKTGDRIAIASNTELFGKGGIGCNKAALLGHFQGDGGTTHFVSYTTASETMLGDFTEKVTKEFPDYCVKYRSQYDYSVTKQSGRSSQNGSQKNDVKEWLVGEDCFGKKSTDKEVPRCIMEGSKEEVRAFLSRLFGCDGWAAVSKHVAVGRNVPSAEIGYGSSSEKLIDGVRHLLQKFGIHSVTRKRKTSCNGKAFSAWAIAITRQEDIKKFASEISIFSKEEQVANVLRVISTKTMSNSELEGVPRGIWKHIKTMIENGTRWQTIVGQKNPYGNERLRWQYSPNKRKIYEYGANTGDNYLKTVGESDVFWDEIKEVRNVGKKKTVALEVPGTNIIGGDIVSHNTLMASVIAVYEAYKLMVINNGDPYSFYNIPLDEKLAVLNVATSLDQAGRLFSHIKARIRNGPFFRGKVDNVSASKISLYSNYDLKRKAEDKGNIKVEGSINLICGHSNPDSLRGWSAICIIFDELAFYDEGAKISGTEFYEALRPSIAQFDSKGDGRVVEISSPGPKTGKFYRIWEDSIKKVGPDEDERPILSFRMPTWVFNPTIDYDTNLELVEARRRDKNKFDVEFGAEWPESAAYGLFFSPTSIVDRALSEGQAHGIVGPEEFAMRGAEYFMHVDPALSNNNYALVIVRKQIYRNVEGVLKPRAILAFSRVWTPRPGVALNYPQIENEVLDICQRFRPVVVSFDNWNSAGTIALLRRHNRNVHRTPFDRGHKARIYQNLKEMILEVNCGLWLYEEPLLIAEMKAIKFKPLARGISIGADPRADITTDDMIDCLAGASYTACGNYNSRLPLGVFVTGLR